MILTYSELNEAQIYKMPDRDSPNHEIEIFMSFNYLYLLKPNGHIKDCHIRKPNDERYLFQVEDNEYVYIGRKLISFEMK